MLTHQAGPSLSSQKPRVFKCDTCEKAFAKPSQLERHSRIHTGSATGCVVGCIESWVSRSEAQKHLWVFTDKVRVFHFTLTFNHLSSLTFSLEIGSSHCDLGE